MSVFGKMNVFSRLTITQKLTGLVAVVLLAFVLIATAYFAMLQSQRNAADAAQSATKFAQGLDKAHLGLLEAQRHEKEFEATRGLEALEAFENAMAVVREEINKLEPQAPDRQTRELLGKLSAAIESSYSTFYQAADTQVALGLDENSGLQGDMRSAVHDVEDRLNKFDNAVLARSMLMMHRHEKDYLLREADKYPKRMAGEQRNFAKLLKASSLPATVKSEITDKMSAYYKTFLAMVQNTQLLRAAQQKADQAAAAVEPVFDQTLKAANAFVTKAQADTETRTAWASGTFFSVLFVLGVVMVAAIFLLARGMRKSLQHLQDTIHKIAEGDTEARANMETGDELGELANAFDNLLDERVARLAEAERQSERLNNSIIGLIKAVAEISKKDFTVKAPVEEDVTGVLGDALNLLVTETSEIVHQVTQVSKEVAAASSKAKAVSDAVTATAHKERLQVQKTSKELEESAEIMNEIAKMAQQANQTADNAIQTTETARETVTGTVEGINTIRDTIRETEKRIKRLGDRSQEITGVVNLINSIAERTHILALNASMHAASAGEAGRGFAVVADEVQRLAENAREATSEISTLVNNIRVETSDTVTTMNTVISQVAEGTRLAQEAGERMQDTQRTTAELVESVQEIATRSQEQAHVSNELREQARQIELSTEETDKRMKLQTQQTYRLVQFAQKLVHAVAVFKLPAREAAAVSEMVIPAKEEAPATMPETPMKQAV